MNEPHASITAAGTEETAAQTGPVAAQQWRFPGPRVRLLFLCRNNSARSPMAEALTRHLTRGQVDVFSAGSHPAPQIHPEAIRAIARLGADIQQYHPKPVANFEGQTFDRVILLQARDEKGGLAFPGPSKVVSWDFADPLASSETGEAQARVFQALATELMIRIRLLLTLLERERREAEAKEQL